MPTILDEVEVRVLGALVEKQMTTPEYYPLTMNALVLACNQKNNRNPVTSLEESAVADAIESLRDKNLVYVFYGSTSRVPKYKHMMGEVFNLDAAELALMCVLMLRGPQTAGELRGRTDRFHNFADLEEVERTLDGLMEKDTQALVAKLARRPGHKEVRYSHLLSGEVSGEVEPEADAGAARKPEVNTARVDRYSKLEEEVERLRTQVETLRQEFEDFKKQFN